MIFEILCAVLGIISIFLIMLVYYSLKLFTIYEQIILQVKDKIEFGKEINTDLLKLNVDPDPVKSDPVESDPVEPKKVKKSKNSNKAKEQNNKLLKY